MSHGRIMGFQWGALFGICISAGYALHWAFFVLAVMPLAGNWAFREVK